MENDTFEQLCSWGIHGTEGEIAHEVSKVGDLGSELASFQHPCRDDRIL